MLILIFIGANNDYSKDVEHVAKLARLELTEEEKFYIQSSLVMF